MKSFLECKPFIVMLQILDFGHKLMLFFTTDHRCERLEWYRKQIR